MKNLKMNLKRSLVASQILVFSEPPQSGGAPNNSQNRGTSHAMANPAMAMVLIPALAVGAVSGVPGPTTNLKIRMDYWGGGQSSAMPAMRGKVPGSWRNCCDRLTRKHAVPTLDSGGKGA